jgi:hypothetical protein
VKLSALEGFTFNDFIAPQKPTALAPGQAHVVCVRCYNKYDDPPDLSERVPPTPPNGNEYWYVWMLDHDLLQLVSWAVRHLNRWHAPEGSASA